MAPFFPNVVVLLRGGERLAWKKVEGRGPTLVWLGGFRSDMAGTKAQALAEVRTMAGDLAAAMTSKLTGVAVGAGDATATIDAVLKERN